MKRKTFRVVSSCLVSFMIAACAASQGSKKIEPQRENVKSQRIVQEPERSTNKEVEFQSKTMESALSRFEEKAAYHEMVSVLIKAALRAEDETVRLSIAFAFGRSDRWVGAVIQLMNFEGDWRVRASAASRLGRIGDPALVLALIMALRDPHGRVRTSAVDALVQIGEPAVPALIEVLKVGAGPVRWHAAQALKKIGSSEAMKAVEAFEQNNEKN